MINKNVQVTKLMKAMDCFKGESMCVDLHAPVSTLKFLDGFNFWLEEGKENNILVLSGNDEDYLYIDADQIKKCPRDIFTDDINVVMKNKVELIIRRQ
jgi:hypothetical protein